MSSTLIAHEVALDAAITLLPLLRSVRGPYADLVDQAKRAMTSVPLNLAEGEARNGKARLNHWRIALGSARETSSALRLLVGIGAVDAEKGHEVLQRLDRVQGMTWSLVNR